ncbi:unnamed protein product, partial [marine sediment metagenome]
GKYVAHLFGQYNYGLDQQHTDYNALEKAFITLFYKSKVMNKSVAIPFNIGCCRGGGNWSIVFDMIERVFGDYDITIYKLDKG